MEFVSGTGQVAEVSSNGILITNTSNHLLEEEPGFEGPSERLPEDDVPDEHFSVEVSDKCLLEVPNKGLLVEMSIESLSEDVPNESHPEEVPSYSLPGESISGEVPSKCFNEEEPSTVVLEVTSQRTVNSSFEISAAEVLLNGAEESNANGAEESNATRESENAPDVGVKEEEVAEVQTNGYKPEVYDSSILLPPWNQARGIIAVFFKKLHFFN